MDVEHMMKRSWKNVLRIMGHERFVKEAVERTRGGMSEEARKRKPRLCVKHPQEAFQGWVIVTACWCVLTCPIEHVQEISPIEKTIYANWKLIFFARASEKEILYRRCFWLWKDHWRYNISFLEAFLRPIFAHKVLQVFPWGCTVHPYAWAPRIQNNTKYHVTSWWFNDKTKAKWRNKEHLN